ncbi:MAG: GntR family transcriptional regulator [Lachnospira sp.]|jgi:GntR family transcriptional regulator|nr:GntR family transcriptional regulator [Lachnospira sp.]
MFVIDLMSRVPVYEQIINQVEEKILIGVLRAGDKMPSVRSLSIELSINPNTIQKAYTELDRKQLIVTVPGKGAFVSDKASEVILTASRDRLTELASMVKQMHFAGIRKEEIIDIVNKVYSGIEI